MARTERKETRIATPLRKATALAASVSLLVPGMVPPAFAQDNADVVAACEAEFEGSPEQIESCLAERGADAGAAPVPDDAAPAPEEAAADTDEAAPATDEAATAADAAPVEDVPAVAEAEEAGDPATAEAADAAPTEGDAGSDELAAAAAAPAESAPVAEANTEAQAEPAAEADAEGGPDAEVEAASEPEAEAAPAAEAGADSAVEPDAPAEPEIAAEPTAPEDGSDVTPTNDQVEDVAPEATDADPTGQANATDPVEETAPAEGADTEAAQAPQPAEAQGDTGADAVAAEGETAEGEGAASAADSAATENADDQATADAEAEAVEAESEPAEQATEDAAPAGDDSEIAAEVAAQPEPELTERQQTARDQASMALEQLLGNGSPAAAAIAGDDAEAEVEQETIAEGDVRTSSEDFETEAVVTENDDDDDDGGLSNTAKIALGALGALAVGTVLANRSRVVSNSGDRVIVQQDDGGLQVFKDDDALLRQSGDDVRTERFDDGSTRTTVTRPDGSRIVTIRDASLRVLRRDRIDPDGTRYTLIDDTEVVEPVDLATLPEPIVSSRADDSGDPLRDALEREAGVDRRFSLAQVRTIPEVRALAPAYEVNTVTFASGSAAITPEQAANLTSLAREVLGTIRENPKEVFLIEGHTDAVGDAAYNLALSDRRAETLALALNEYFDVPVENMVVQGYGEEFLKVPTLEAEQENRRATVRQITGLLRTAAAD